MNEQDKPLALELAETLEYHGATCEQIEAAEELRRLHAENEELKKQSVFRLGVIEELKTIARSFDIEDEELRRDAECFRFWVREAEASPSAMAKLIINCRTEEDYRNVIEPLAMAAQNAIDAAMKDK